MSQMRLCLRGSVQKIDYAIQQLLDSNTKHLVHAQNSVDERILHHLGWLKRVETI